MVSSKELSKKIASIQNTKKITTAMEVVAISKMRKLKNNLAASIPCVNLIRKVVLSFLRNHIEYKRFYLEERNFKRVGYVVISTDRGLCGGLNANLFKKLLVDIKVWLDKGVQNDLVIIGSKGVSFFNSINSNVISQITNIEHDSFKPQLMIALKKMLHAYDEYRLSALYVVKNKFINMVSQVPTIIQLLPFKMLEQEENKFQCFDYLYETDLKILLNILLRWYIESQVFQSVVENLVSEQAARILAMKTATDNSQNLIEELKLLYNKSRQASITQELIEIVSGVILSK